MSPAAPAPVLDAPVAPPSVPPLTVLIPVYNEERTVETLLQRVADGPYPDKQIIVIDDGSSDATPRLLERWRGRAGFLFLRHEHNRGKGAAVRTGLVHAVGEVTIIQDADLEYEPADYPRLVEPILRGKAEAVYGSRYLAPSPPAPLPRSGGEGRRGEKPPWTVFRVGVVVFNLLVLLLYGRRLTDEATCYKALRTGLWRALDLRAKRFELCPEMTAKLCRRGVRITEVPISYHPRGASAGKKIGWRDAVQTVWTLLRWRFRQLEARDRPLRHPAPAGMV